MQKDTKVLIASLLFTFLLIVGISFLLGGRREDEGVVNSEAVGVETIPQEYELGEVPIDGGIVSREYEIKNTTGQTIKLKKIATSCVCTTAKVVVGDKQSLKSGDYKETPFFGMEHPMDKNPPVNLEIGAGEVAKAVVNYDPAAHGPEGTGSFERVVFLTFSDPAGVKELKFNGTVVK